jgi:hypothetical protein
VKGKFKKGQEDEFKAAFELLCQDEDVIAAAKYAVECRVRLAAKLSAVQRCDERTADSEASQRHYAPYN